METTHVVWLSGGKDSTAMALRLAETRPETDWRFVCTPTGNELPDIECGVMCEMAERELAAA